MFMNRSTRRATGNSATKQRSHLQLEILEDRRVLSSTFGLVGNNFLINFDTSNPEVIIGSKRITGVSERSRVFGHRFPAGNRRALCLKQHRECRLQDQSLDRRGHAGRAWNVQSTVERESLWHGL